MLTYFDYEEVVETDDSELVELMKRKNVLFCIQPHGVMPFVNFCNHIHMAQNDMPIVKTAVASIIFKMPVVKNVMGLFGTVDASQKSLLKELETSSVDLYVGGMAELFLANSDSPQEMLYLLKRKGFIKLALKAGCEIIPIYAFGNATILKVLNWDVLAKISRAIGISITWTYGRYFLPICLPRKCVYVRGRPLGLPKISNPTQEDIDNWHEKYIEEVKRLFKKYQEKCPEYRRKELVLQ